MAQTNILTAQTTTLPAEANLTAEMILALSGYLVSLTRGKSAISSYVFPSRCFMKMFCHRCGFSVGVDAKFLAKCGGN